MSLLENMIPGFTSNFLAKKCRIVQTIRRLTQIYIKKWITFLLASEQQAALQGNSGLAGHSRKPK